MTRMVHKWLRTIKLKLINWNIYPVFRWNKFQLIARHKSSCRNIRLLPTFRYGGKKGWNSNDITITFFCVVILQTVNTLRLSLRPRSFKVINNMSACSIATYYPTSRSGASCTHPFHPPSSACGLTGSCSGPLNLINEGVKWKRGLSSPNFALIKFFLFCMSFHVMHSWNNSNRLINTVTELWSTHWSNNLRKNRIIIER